MKKKYQIFVSSTYEDLKDERDLVIKAILEMGHIPVGMEMFSAGDEQQWKLIQTQIDDCDYYVVIAGFKYGSLDGNISYTEKEYDYAVQKNIPVLGFIIEEGTSLSKLKFEKQQVKIKKLENFKSKIKSKIISYWKDKNDLYGKVSIALMKQFNMNPRIGWVKAAEFNTPEVLTEISRLSNENSELRKNIEELKNKIADNDIKTLDMLKHNVRSISFYYQDSSEWEDKTEFSLLKIFDLLAPNLVIEDSVKNSATFLAVMLKPDKERVQRSLWPTPVNTVRRIFADFNALDIIEPSPKKHSISDDNEYWTLTKEGKKLYKYARREILDNNLNNLEEEVEKSDSIENNNNK